MHQSYSSSVSPFQAKTGTPVAAIAAAEHAVERALERKAAEADGAAVKVLYGNKDQLKAFCKRLNIMEDLKAGVPRTAYHGVVTLRSHGRLVYLAPSYKVDQDITVVASA